MSNVRYKFKDNYCIGVLPSSMEFLISFEDFSKINNLNLYVSIQGGRPYLVDNKGKKLHHYLFKTIKGLEIDHINLDTLDNRRNNIRYCTHQQNQINQSLQRNNTSGVSGVSFYSPRNKFRSRIKVSQKDIHLGYYDTFENAVQARNVAMECMFGQYARYNDVEEAPKELRNKVIEKCASYKELSNNSAFFDFWEVEDE